MITSKITKDQKSVQISLEETKLSPNKSITSREPSLTLAQHKRLRFVETLKKEFKCELLYAHAADHERAPKKDPFITKVRDQIKNLLSVLPLEGITATIGSVVNAVGNILSMRAEQVRDDRLALIANLVNKLDLVQLDIILENVARAALRCYEPFIVDRLSDDDIDKNVGLFAETGARRMLQFISCQSDGLILTESILLTGLIEGRSGGGVDGFFNCTLKLKHHGLHSDESISAECVYNRPAFQVFEFQKGELVDKLYTHKIKSTKRAVRLVKRKTEPFTKTRKKVKEVEHDPKAGFIVMDESKINGYGYELLATKKLQKIQDRVEYKYEFEKKEDTLSASLQTELNTSASHSIVNIDLITFDAFLKWSKENERRSIVEYMRSIFKLPNVELIVCKKADLRTCDLNQANLSHMDLSGSIMGGKDKVLNEINFEQSYLVGVIVEEGICFNKCNFHRTHCEFLKAERVQFKDSTLTQTNFSFANLKHSRIEKSISIGAIWYEANLTGIEEQSILEEQRKQIEQIKKEMDLFRVNLFARIETIADELKEVKIELESHKLHLKRYHQTLRHVLQFSLQDHPIPDFTNPRYLHYCLKQEIDTEPFQNAFVFIKTYRFTARYQKLLHKLSGLVSDDKRTEVPLYHFWNALLAKPLDITGVGLIRIIIGCLEQANCDSRIPHIEKLIAIIQKAVIFTFVKDVDEETFITYLYYCRHIIIPKHNKNMLDENRELSIRKDFAMQIFPILATSPKVFQTVGVINIYLKHLNCESIDTIESNSRELGAIISAGWLFQSLRDKSASTKIIDEFIIIFLSWKESIRCIEVIRSLAQLHSSLVDEEIFEFLFEAFEKSRYPLSYIIPDTLRKLALDVINEPKIKNTFLKYLNNPKTRFMSAEILIESNDEKINEQCREIFLNHLRDKTDNIDKALKSIQRLGKKMACDPIIQALIKILNTEYYSEDDKRCAVDALETMGVKAATDEVIRSLINSLERVPHAPESLGNLLQLIDSEPYVTLLLSLLENGNEKQQNSVLQALGYIGKPAAQSHIVQTLCAVYKKYASLRENVIFAFKRLSPFIDINDGVVSILIEALENRSNDVRTNAASALGKMGEKAASKEVINALFKAYNYKEFWLFRKAATKSKGFEYTCAFFMLHVPAANVSLSARQTAARAIGKLGKTAATKENIDKLCEFITGDCYTEWSGVHDAVTSLNFGEKQFIVSLLNELGWYIYDETIKKAFKSLTIATDLLIQIYKEIQHPFLPELIIINSLREGIPITLDNNDVVIHIGQEPIRFNLGTFRKINDLRIEFASALTENGVNLIDAHELFPMPVPRLPSSTHREQRHYSQSQSYLFFSSTEIIAISKSKNLLGGDATRRLTS